MYFPGENMKNQHSFPQRVGKLIEKHIIEKDKLFPNRRQHKIGYYDAYKHDKIYEIKAAKNDNYFRLSQNNHKLLESSDGEYILVRYVLINKDDSLKIISDIDIKSIKYIPARVIKQESKSWLEDQRKKNLYYKVKI